MITKKQRHVLVLLGLAAALVSVIVIARGLYLLLRLFQKPNTMILSKQQSISIQEYMQHPSKCFDCEAQLAQMGAWKSQKSKCFTCDAVMGI